MFCEFILGEVPNVIFWGYFWEHLYTALSSAQRTCKSSVVKTLPVLIFRLIWTFLVECMPACTVRKMPRRMHDRAELKEGKNSLVLGFSILLFTPT